MLDYIEVIQGRWIEGIWDDGDLVVYVFSLGYVEVVLVFGEGGVIFVVYLLIDCFLQFCMIEEIGVVCEDVFCYFVCLGDEVGVFYYVQQFQ